MTDHGIREILGPDGAVAGRLPGYEARDVQVEMAEAVGEAFDTGRHLLVEAGTGVGKSFAYLVPAILRAAFHGERVLISTHTISLQEQLVGRDIPFLASVLPWKFKAALVKGRSNYICLRRMDLACRREANLFPDELGRIVEWARYTKDGSRSDLENLPDPRVWEQVQAEHDNCMGRRSPHHEACFYQKARAEAQAADILVVNHHLLFADLALRRMGARYLPEVDRIILDEAHSLENIASEYLGQRITRRGIGRLVRAAWNPRTRRGIVQGTPYEGAVARAVEEAETAADRLFGDLLAIRGEEQVIRLREPARVDDSLSAALRRVGDAMAPLIAHATSEEEETEIRAVTDRFEATGAALTDLLAQESEGHVYWLEREEIRSAPIHVGPILQEWIFEKFRGVVLTSATLSVGGQAGFDYIRDRLGVPDPVERVLGSPFRYREQVQIVVPRDLPEPTSGEAFLEAAADRIRRYLDLAGGRAFVLFTSHVHLRRVREMLRSFFEEKGIVCFSQGEGLPRGRMLERFREDVRSVLFGVDSFWEGVDVPGEALSNVIIVKIPFSVPTRPLVEARADEVRSRGEDPFRVVSLPEAALRLRQGFGRLVRSQEDRGVVAILDTRIHRREYGRFLMQALPDCEILTDWPDEGEAP